MNLKVNGQPVRDLAEDDAHCYIWVTNWWIRGGYKVLDAWGFKYMQMITWAKPGIGIGQYFRGQTEHVLFGVRGHLPFRIRPDGKRAQGSTLLVALRREHSRKPDEMRQMIEHVSVGPYLELFARHETPGWDVWGDEVPSEDGVIDVVTHLENLDRTNPSGKRKPWQSI